MLSVQRQLFSRTTLHGRKYPALSPSRHCSSRTQHHRRSSHSLSRSDVRRPDAAKTPDGSFLSKLDVQDCWSASGLASSITAAQLEPSLSRRPITTHVNVLLAGSGHYLGKAPYYSTESYTGTAVAASLEATSAKHELNSPAKHPSGGPGQAAAATACAAAPPEVSSNGPYDLHAAFLKDPAAWATQLLPVPSSEACREMVYKFQDSPGQGSTLDASAHVMTLLSHLLQQQAKDYKNKSLAHGCLQHSVTACFYFLPPHGPSKLDLVAMSALSQHVALLPVLSQPAGASDEQAQQMQATVQQILEETGAYVEGLQRIMLHTLGGSGMQLPLLQHAPAQTSPQESGFNLKRVSGMQLPLLQHAPAQTSPQESGFNLKRVVQLLNTDEVYGLLDDAWERYSTFCEAYEAAGKDLPAMTTQLHSQLLQHLPSVAALQKAAEQLSLLQKETGVALAKMKTHAAVSQQQETFFKELAVFLKAAASCTTTFPVHSGQNLVTYLEYYLHPKVGLEPQLPRATEELKEKLMKVL